MKFYVLIVLLLVSLNSLAYSADFKQDLGLIQAELKAGLIPVQYVSYGGVDPANTIGYLVGTSSQIYFSQHFGLFIGVDQLNRSVSYTYSGFSSQARAPFADFSFGPVFRAKTKDAWGSLLVAKAGVYYSLPMRTDFLQPGNSAPSKDGYEAIGTTQRTFGILGEVAFYFPVSRVFHLGPSLTSKVGFLSPLKESAANFNFSTDWGVSLSGLVSL